MHLPRSSGNGPVEQFWTLAPVVRQLTYPKTQLPQTRYLHRCKPSQWEHSLGFFWQSRRLVFATIRLSGLRSLLPTALSFPFWMAILPSSKRTLCRTASATVKVCEIFSSRRPKSKEPWLSHRVLMINLEIIEVILGRY